MLEITPIPTLSDNYTWLVRQPKTGKAAVVDPGEAGPVLSALEGMDAKLSAILITHHHQDHVGGVKSLAHGNVVVYGPADSVITGITNPVRPGEHIEPAELFIDLKVIAAPGHTLDHIVYYGDGVLFAGDALFAGGCGRLFEGSAKQMQEYLATLRELPNETKIYCGHEYTLKNLEFAAAVEPNNTRLASRLEQVREQRARNAITLPSTMGEEKATNPFLRWDNQGVIASASQWAGQSLTTPVEVFAALRRWKDQF
ncbi:MAG: hydroxyacylglutathione hydrolase [Gammaproteobacteria bacterium]|nr:hydroxyacylglutathione hydrolase [Gammaproteobacteria bacterium]